MRLSYVDTSAAMKLIVDEVESAAPVDALADRRLVASWLLRSELHCAAGRHPDLVAVAAVNQVLDGVNLADITRGDLMAAGSHPPLGSKASGWETSTPCTFDGVKSNGDRACGSTTFRLGFDDRWRVRTASEDLPSRTC